MDSHTPRPSLLPAVVVRLLAALTWTLLVAVTSTALAQTPAPSPPRPASGTTCCCAQWSRGWQHTWVDASQCSSNGGSCVAFDRCAP